MARARNLVSPLLGLVARWRLIPSGRLTVRGAAQFVQIGKPTEDGVVSRRFLTRSAAWLTRTELLWLVLLAPLMVFPDYSRALVALLGLALLLLARRIAHLRFIIRTPMDAPIALLLFMALVSMFVATDPAAALPKVTGLLLGVSLFYALIELPNDGITFERTLLVFAFAGILPAATGLLESVMHFK